MATLALVVASSNAGGVTTVLAGETSENAVRRIALPDLDYRTVDPFKTGSARAVVFVFVSTDCPISNRYAPEVRRLHEKFSPRGVKFWLIYPNNTESIESIRRHVKEYRFPCGALLDPKHELVKAARARVTPEAAVFVSGSKLLYHGRIDDWHVDFGKARPAPTQRDLNDVLEAILSGQPIPHASAPAVGCYISD